MCKDVRAAPALFTHQSPALWWVGIPLRGSREAAERQEGLEWATHMLLSAPIHVSLSAETHAASPL